MKKALCIFSAIALCTAILFCFSIAALATGPLNTSDLTVEVNFERDNESKYSHFSIELIPDSPDCPMPDGSENGIKTVMITNSGMKSFGTIYYNTPGEYRYTVHQYIGDDGGVTYDKTIYNIIVQVNSETGELVASTWITAESSTAKFDTIRFSNIYNSANDPNNPYGNGNGFGNNQNGGPQTGDESHLVRYLGMFSVSSICLVSMCIATRKRRKNCDN